MVAKSRENPEVQHPVQFTNTQQREKCETYFKILWLYHDLVEVPSSVDMKPAIFFTSPSANPMTHQYLAFSPKPPAPKHMPRSNSLILSPKTTRDFFLGAPTIALFLAPMEPECHPIVESQDRSLGCLVKWKKRSSQIERQLNILTLGTSSVSLSAVVTKMSWNNFR